MLGKFHGQMSLVGYSPWGRKESDTTEDACTHVPLRKKNKFKGLKLSETYFILFLILFYF